MADADRTFQQYKVVGRCAIVDSKTGEDIAPGGVVNLDPEDSVRTFETGEVQDVPGVNIRALLAAGHIAPLDKPAGDKDTGKKA